MRKLRNITILIILVIAFTILMPVKVQAGLQANKGGTALYTKTASEFFELIRTMETGTLGKENVGATDGIDCHMAKNTEWGGALILSACSRYGKAPGTSSGSTTRNESGVYDFVTEQREYTAHYLIGATQYADNLVNAVSSENGKYVNVYLGTDESNYIAGDAFEFGTIVGTYYGEWDETNPVLARGRI